MTWTTTNPLAWIAISQIPVAIFGALLIFWTLRRPPFTLTTIGGDLAVGDRISFLGGPGITLPSGIEPGRIYTISRVENQSRVKGR